MNAVGRYFDQWAEGWDESAEPSGAKHEAIARLAGVCEGSRVLDVGCGTGIMVPAYLSCGAGSVVGLDVSQGMVDVARRKFAGDARVSFECTDVVGYPAGAAGGAGVGSAAGDAADVCDPDAASRGNALFDVVVVYNAYPHILDKRALVAAVARLLKPGGRFLVAHGFGREALNAHHAHVPADVTTELLPVEDSVLPWRAAFDIDMQADAPHLFFFGGSLR